MGKDWIKKHKSDKYYKQAQKEGIRSRAAFKIRQIQLKFNILNNAKLILDLCCAPGSWIEEIQQEFNEISIIGVDLVTITPLKGVLFIQGDIQEDSLISKLEEHLINGVDVVLSDCAPKFTGSKETDIARQLFLIQRVFKISSRFLKEGGNLVCKLFDGNYIQKLRSQLKQKFDNIYFFKPQASRKKSPELYFIGKIYKKGDLAINFS